VDLYILINKMKVEVRYLEVLLVVVPDNSNCNCSQFVVSMRFIIYFARV
jgi:hypothetical protein